MTIESQKASNARYEELTRLAKLNVCWECGGLLEVVLRGVWIIWCASCNTFHSSKWFLKPRLTRAEETKERLAKMEIAAKTPPKRDYNIDDLWR